MSKKRNTVKDGYLQSIGEYQEFIKSNDEKLTFSFRYYQFGDEKGESFEEWEKEQILSDLNNKLKHFSEKKKKELLADKTLEIFINYPPDSEFIEPKELLGYRKKWARFRLTGRRRLIGFFAENIEALKSENVFYIVFLDKNHRFAPAKKNEICLCAELTD